MAVMSSRTRGQRNEKQSRQPHSHHHPQQKEVQKEQRELEGPRVNQKFVVDSVVPPKVHFDNDKTTKSKALPPLPISSSSSTTTTTTTTSLENKEKQTTHPLSAAEEEEDEYRKRGLIVYPFTYSLISAATSCSLPSSYRPETSRIIDIDKSVVGVSSISIPTTTTITPASVTSSSSSTTTFTTYTAAFSSPSSIFYAVPGKFGRKGSITKTKSVDILGSPSILKSFRELDEPTRFSNSRTRTPLNIYTPPPSRVLPIQKNKVKGNLPTTTKKSPLESSNGHSNVSSAISESENQPTSPKEASNTVSIRQIRESLASKRKQDSKNLSKSEEVLPTSSSSTNMPLRVRMRRDEYYYTETSSKCTQTDEREFYPDGKNKEKSSRRTSVSSSSGRRKSSSKYIVEKVDRSTSPIPLESENGGSYSGSRRQSLSSAAYLKKLEDLEKITGHFVIQRFFTKTDQEFGLWLEQQLQQTSTSSSSFFKGVSESRPESNVGFILDRVPEKTVISTITATETPAPIGNIFPQPLVLPPITQTNHKSLFTQSQIQSQDQAKQKNQTENITVPLEKLPSKTSLTTPINPTTTTTDAAKTTISTSEALSVTQISDTHPFTETKNEEKIEEKLPAVPKVPCYLLSNSSTTSSSIPCSSNSISTPIPSPLSTSTSSVSVLASVLDKTTPSPSILISNTSTNVTQKELEKEKGKQTEKEKEKEPDIKSSQLFSPSSLKQDKIENVELLSITTEKETLELEKAPKITEQPRPGAIDEIDKVEVEATITKTTFTPTTKATATVNLVEEAKKSETSLKLKKEEQLGGKSITASTQSIDKLEAEIIVIETPTKTTATITAAKPPEPPEKQDQKLGPSITIETKVMMEEKDKVVGKDLEKVEMVHGNGKEIVESCISMKENTESQQEQQQRRQCKKDDFIPCECFVKFFLQEENIAKLLISLSPRTSTPLISPKDDIKEEETSHFEKQSDESNKPKIQKMDIKLADDIVKSTKATTTATVKTEMDPLESFEKFEAALHLSKSKSQSHIQQLPVRIPSAKKQNNDNSNNSNNNTNSNKQGKINPRKIKHSESLPIDVTKSTTTTAMLTTTTTILTMDHNDHKFHFQQYTNSNRNLGQSENHSGLRKSASVDSCIGTVSTDLSSIKTASNDSGVHQQDQEKFLMENLNMSQDSHQSMSIGGGGTTSAVLLLLEEEEIVSNKDSGLGGSSGRSNSQWFDDHDHGLHGHSVSFTRQQEEDAVDDDDDEGNENDEVIITPTTMMMLESEEVEESKNKATKVQSIEEQQQQQQTQKKQIDDNIVDEVQIYSADSDSESEIVISENYHAGSDEEIEEDVAGDGDDDETDATTGAEALGLSQVQGQNHGSNKAGGRDDNTDVDILDDDDDDDDDQDNLLARIELDELRLEMDMNLDGNNDKPLAQRSEIPMIRNTCTQTNRSLFSSAWSNATSTTSSSSSATTTTGEAGSYIDLEVISNKIQTAGDGNSGELHHAKRNYLPSSSSSLNFVNCNMNFSVKNDESKFRMSLTLPGAATGDIRGVNRQSFMHRHHHHHQQQLQKKLYSQRKSVTHGESKYKGENDLPSLWANVKDRLDSKVSLADGQQQQINQKDVGESGEDSQLVVGGSRALIKSRGESRKHKLEKSQRPSHQNLPQQQSHFVRSTGHNNHNNDDRIKRSLERLSKLLDIEKKQ